MTSFSTVTAGTAILMVALSTPAWATDPLPAVVRHYVTAWEKPSDADFGHLFAADGEYYDADWDRTVTAGEFADYRRSLSGLVFELQNESTDGSKVTLVWKVSDTVKSWQATDTLVVEANSIVSVVSEGATSLPADAAWVDRFIAARRSMDPAAFRSFMDPAGVVVGSSFAERELSVDGFIAFMGTIPGTIYERLPQATIYRAKDGHFYYEFHVLASGGRPLVLGRDHIVVRNGRITRFEGVY